MTLCRLDVSIRVEGSRSRKIADIAEREWLAANPEAAVIRRSVGTDPIPSGAQQHSLVTLRKNIAPPTSVGPSA